MLKTLIFEALKKALENAVRTGQLSDLLTKLLSEFLSKGALQMTVPVNDSVKDFLSEALLELVRQLLASGKLNDLIMKLLQGLLGSQSFTLPLTTTQCHDVEIEGDVLAFTHNDGAVHRVDLSDLLN